MVVCVFLFFGCIDKLLLLGGMNPKLFDSLLDISENIIIAGASWYLDSKRYVIHLLGHKKYVGIQNPILS